MRTRSDLREYQVRGARFVIHKRYCALLVDMGLGKTIMVLTAIVRLILAGKIENVLIVGPLRVVQAVWRQEAKLWQHTKKLKFSLVQGTPVNRVRALNTPAHVYLINVENLQWLDQVYGKRKAMPFDMLVVDESSMFKKVKTVRFGVMRRRVKDFKRRVIMTGTPTPNGLHEIWPQMYICDRGYFLGRTYTEFKGEFFDTGGYKNYKLIPKRGATEEVITRTSPIVMRLDAKDWLELPPLMTVPVFVELPESSRVLYDRLETDMFIAFEETGTFVANPHAAALRNRCSQLASGAIYAEHEETAAKVWQHVHDSKMDALTEIVEELQGEPPVVLYRFGHDRVRITGKYPRYGLLGKGTKSRDFEHIVESWNRGKLPGLVMSPASAGHGLNLQHGGRHFVWFSLTESAEQYLQAIKRLHRSGQTGTVINYVLIARNTVDEVVWSDVQWKLNNQQDVNDKYRDSTFAEYMRRRTADI